MRHGSLFSGIGGFDLAAEWMGWENVFHCEWNEFGQKVLHHYWPEAELFSDITKSNFTKYANTIDVLSGGFPCQPYSSAGNRLGKEDERHLWPEMLRAIREIQPSWVVGENVRGLTNWNGGMVFDEVQSDLEAEGYEVLPFLLPACAVNAPHRRDRIWFVAYRKYNRLEHTIYKNTEREIFKEKTQGRQNGLPNLFQPTKTNSLRTTFTYSNLSGCKTEREQSFSTTQSKRISNKSSRWERFPTQSPICNRDDGISDRLDSITFPKWRNESIKAGGNAVVPQVVHQIFKAIELYERSRTPNKD